MTPKNIAFAALFYLIVGFKTNGKVIINPEEQESAVGNDVIFVCASDNPPVSWYHLEVSSDSSQPPSDLYQNGHYYDRCDDKRCSVSDDGKFLMRNISLADAGKFTCTDSESAVTAELIVFDLYPSYECCYIRQWLNPSTEEMNCHLTCSMRYRGNLIPLLEWTQNGEEYVIPSTDKTINGITTSSIHLSTDQFRNYSYSCKVRYQTDSITSKYQWSTIAEPPSQRSSIQEVNTKLSKVTGSFIWTTIAILLAVTSICVLLGRLCYPNLKRSWNRRQRPVSDTEKRQNDPLLPNINVVEEDANMTDSQTTLSLNQQIEDNVKGAHDPVSLKFTRGIDLDIQSKVSGMVTYDNKIYMVYLMSNKLSVFKDEPPFKKAGEDLTLEEIKEPRLIDACIVSQCIYLADAFCECIWKIGQQVLEEKQNTINTWKTKFLYPYKFSVMSRGRILIPSFPVSMLTIYKLDGTTERQIYLGMSLSSNETMSCFASCNLPPTDQTRLEPIYAIETSTGNILVSCGDKESKMHVVLSININSNPEIMWQYGDNKGYENGQFNCPRHLAVDEDGMIYVADQYNRRVIILNTSGQRVGSEKITTDVTRVCYLRNCKKLLAGFASINCYNVKKNIIQEGANTIDSQV